MPIDAKVEAEKLRNLYNDDPRQDLASILMTGESGKGKTFSLRTAPFPVHIDSFDPRGTKSVRDLIDKGDVIADVRFENDDPFNPHAFKLWTKEFEARRVGKYFESIGTYCLDSASTYTEAVMNFIQKNRKAEGTVPLWEKDYHPQKVELRKWISKITSLPCHVIVTGHLEPQKDKEGNIIGRRFLMTGKGAIVVPLLFDEIWVLENKETSKGLDYYTILQSTGMFLARSRLAGTGSLGEKEPTNLRNIFKKAGLNYEDKPKLF
uniref:Putative ATPase domain containing protein n=1 Tax=viral metagenome TaxID=1070528 RepID=A0A6H1ZPR0_9ZZZZ